MRCVFSTGTYQYSQQQCSRTGNPYFQGAFLSCPVWGGYWLSSITMGPPSCENWNDVKLSRSINIQPKILSLGILLWHFPIWRHSTRAFRDERYHPQKGISKSLMGLQRNVWTKCGSGNESLHLPKSGVQGYQDRDGIWYHWIQTS